MAKKDSPRFVAENSAQTPRFIDTSLEPTQHSLIKSKPLAIESPKNDADILAKKFCYFTYSATVLRVVDGDTIVVTVDRGFEDSSEKTIRLARIDCPEPRGKSKKLGIAATNHTKSLVPPGTPIAMISHKLDNWGRSIASVYFVECGKVVNLSDRLVGANHAVYKDY